MADVVEDLVDDARVGDICDDAQCAATQGTYGDIELEGTPEALCPGQSMQFGRFWLAWLVRLFRGVGRSVARFEWFAGHDAGPQFAVGCEHPVVTGEIDPWPGNQGREPGEQVQRFEEKVGRAVGVGVLECIAQLAVVCYG